MGASLLCCLVTIVLWVRSYTGTDAFIRSQVVASDATRTRYRTHVLQWNRGLVQLVIRREITSDNGTVHWSFMPPRGVPPHRMYAGPMTPELARAHWSYARFR